MADKGEDHASVAHDFSWPRSVSEQNELKDSPKHNMSGNMDIETENAVDMSKPVDFTQPKADQPQDFSNIKELSDIDRNRERTVSNAFSEAQSSENAFSEKENDDELKEAAHGADPELTEGEHGATDAEHGSDMDHEATEGEMEGTEVDGEEANEEDSKFEQVTPEQKARHAITGRGVTLPMLMADGLIKPGENNMSIEYLGQRFTADLLKDGRIRWREENKIFGSPSAWAIHCKKIVNPMKKSGCGWASVKYKGRKLNSFKSSWFRKHKPISTLATHSSSGQKDSDKSDSDSDDGDGKKKIKLEPEDSVPVTRYPVKHHTLGRRSKDDDVHKLVELTHFPSLGKVQPFNVSVSTNCLFLADFHCHLTTSEVVGYLGGTWDPHSQCLQVKAAFPCRCRLGDKENAGAVETEIKQSMQGRGLTLVGWYHSHPTCSAEPSVQDVESQMEHQLNLRGGGASYRPCLGLIFSPSNTLNSQSKPKESTVKAFWVMPPPEQRPLDYGMPMSLYYETQAESNLDSEIPHAVKSLIEFYEGEPDRIQFNSAWLPGFTQMDRLTTSLTKRLPKDQDNTKIFEDLKAVLS